MGLGPSYQPSCRYCQQKTQKHNGEIIQDGNFPVIYVCNLYHYRPAELEPWWIRQILSNGENLYHACEECILSVPLDYSQSFIYAPNYQVRGL